MILKSPAKVNLFLHVTGRKKNGYHTLETIFQFLDIQDTLEFKISSSDQIRRIDNHDHVLPAEDLIIKAAKLLANDCKLKNPPGVNIVLNKIIPPGAGMGGGSSNAATTLIGLNRLWKLGRTHEELLELAGQLGADVPVFVHGNACWASGTGNQFTHITPRERWLCLYIPKVNVSTERVFSHPDLIRDHPSISVESFDYQKTTNDLEPITRSLFREIDEAFQLLSHFGQPRMNGSGASVFISCDTKRQAETIRESLPDPSLCVITRTLNTITRPQHHF